MTLAMAAAGGADVPTAGFGFEIPQGDPGAISDAAEAHKAVGLALGAQGEIAGGAARNALGAGSWSGDAANAFSGAAERLLHTIGLNVDAATTAAAALTELSAALTAAQAATTAAMADCVAAQQTQQEQQQAADEAGQRATQAHQQADSAPHPAAAHTYRTAAHKAEADQASAQAAANAAASDLSDAQRRGQKALQHYQVEAKGAAQKLEGAAHQYKKPSDDASAWDAVVAAFVGVNTYAGALATGVQKADEVGIDDAMEDFWKGMEAQLNRESNFSTLKGDSDDDLVETDDADWADLARNQNWADSDAVQLFTKSLSDSTPVLDKVPILATVLTAADVATDLAEGKDAEAGKAAEDLPVTVVLAETAAPKVVSLAAKGRGLLSSLTSSGAEEAGAEDLLAEGGGEVLAASAIPGVGEIVIGGAVVLGGTWVIEHPVQAWHGIEAGATGVVHGVEWANNEINDGANWVDNQISSGVSTVTHDAGQVVSGLGHDASSVAHSVGHDASSVAHSVGHDLNPENWF